MEKEELTDSSRHERARSLVEGITEERAKEKEKKRKREREGEGGRWRVRQRPVEHLGDIISSRLPRFFSRPPSYPGSPSRIASLHMPNAIVYPIAR